MHVRVNASAEWQGVSNGVGGGECRRRASSRPYSGDVVDKIVSSQRCLPASGEGLWQCDP